MISPLELSKRYERAGHDESSIGFAPTHQNLCATQATGPNIDNRLIEWHEFVGFDCPFELRNRILTPARNQIANDQDQKRGNRREQECRRFPAPGLSTHGGTRQRHSCRQTEARQLACCMKIAIGVEMCVWPLFGNDRAVAHGHAHVRPADGALWGWAEIEHFRRDKSPESCLSVLKLQDSDQPIAVSDRDDIDCQTGLAMWWSGREHHVRVAGGAKARAANLPVITDDFDFLQPRVGETRSTQRFDLVGAAAGHSSRPQRGKGLEASIDPVFGDPNETLRNQIDFFPAQLVDRMMMPIAQHAHARCRKQDADTNRNQPPLPRGSHPQPRFVLVR